LLEALESMLGAKSTGGPGVKPMDVDAKDCRPNQFQSLALPLDFPPIMEAYLRNPGVSLVLRGGGPALSTRPAAYVS